MQAPLSRTVVRFLAVGAANTAIDVVLFWVLQAPLGIVAANLVSTSAGMAFSFRVNGRHTFGAGRSTPRQAGLFVGSNALTMWVLQPLVIVAAQSMLGAPLMGAKVVALAGSVVADFLLYRHLVWREARPLDRVLEARARRSALRSRPQVLPQLRWQREDE
jgi:putative flippase GtrA